MKSIALFAVLVIIALFPQDSAPGGALGALEAPAPMGVPKGVMIFDRPYALSLSGGPGFFYGTSREIIYRNSQSGLYLSELQWDIKPLFYLGFAVELGTLDPLQGQGFFLNLGFKAALPMKTGVMEDRDWLPQDPLNTHPQMLTNFSSHDNHTKAMFLFNFDGGFSQPIVNHRVLLKFLLNFEYRYFNWEAWDGYTQYGPNIPTGSTFIPWSDSFPKDPFRGLGISYSQHWILAGIGAGMEFPLGRFKLSAVLLFCPLVFCIDSDIHYKGNREWNEIMWGGLSFNPKCNLGFEITPKIVLDLSIAYHYITETRGDVYSGSSMNAPGMGGAAFEALEGSLSLRYRF